MAFFSKKPNKVEIIPEPQPVVDHLGLDISVLRKNNIRILSIDERWKGLFSAFAMKPGIEKMQNDMNEIVKKQAILLQEMDQMEPSKKKAMQQIMYLTKEAFENDNKQAKDALQKCREEIERLNLRWSVLVEELSAVEEKLKNANFELLVESIRDVFTTLKTNIDRSNAIDSEVLKLEEQLVALKAEKMTINLDWSGVLKYFDSLIGNEELKRFETSFLGMVGRPPKPDENTESNSVGNTSAKMGDSP